MTKVSFNHTLSHCAVSVVFVPVRKDLANFLPVLFTFGEIF